MFRISDNASAAWRFKGFSIDRGAGCDGGDGFSGRRRTMLIWRGRGGGGSSFYQHIVMS